MLSKDTLLLTTLACALGAGVALAGDAPRPGSAADLVQQVRREKDAAKRAAIVKKLEKMGKKAEKALMGSWKKVDDRTAVDLLLLIERLKTDNAREDLIQATKSRKPVIRRISASGLGMYGHADTEKALFRLVKDRDPDVYTAALESIQNLQSKTTYKPLLRAIRRYDDDPQSKRFGLLMGVGRALVKGTHDLEIVRELCRMAAQEDEEHQVVFLSILDVGEKQVCAPILREVLKEYVEGDDYEGPGFEKPLRDSGTAEALRPITPEFAQIAIKGLGLARDSASRESMISALSDSSAEVRLKALQFLHLTLPKGPRVIGEEAPEEYPEVRRRAIKAVMTRLTDRSRGVRQRAYVWLKRETKQRKLPITFAAWKGWYQTYFGEDEEDYEEDSEEDSEEEYE
jgi:HEAT repeat protein